MHWTRFLVAVICSGVATSMTDWFFAGDWIHVRYTYPEIWREGPESRAILISSIFPFATCAAFLILTSWCGDYSIGSVLRLALIVWIIGPLPLMLRRVHLGGTEPPSVITRVWCVLHGRSNTVKVQIPLS